VPGAINEFFTSTPQEFGQEIRGIAVVDIRNGKFVRWVTSGTHPPRPGEHPGTPELA